MDVTVLRQLANARLAALEAACPSHHWDFRLFRRIVRCSSKRGRLISRWPLRCDGFDVELDDWMWELSEALDDQGAVVDTSFIVAERSSA